MVKLYDDFKDKGLAVISVSLDERKDVYKRQVCNSFIIDSRRFSRHKPMEFGC